MIKKLISALLAIAVFFPAAAFADDGSLGGTGETVYPVGNTNIVMQKEVIDIRLKGSRAYYTCRFWFNNEGKTVKQLTGFPCKDKSHTRQNDWDNVKLYRFRSYVNNHRVPVDIKYGMKKTVYNKGEDYYPVWYTFNVGHKKGQTKKVTNTYWCYNSADSSGYQYISYILKTGASWKDKIGKVIVRLNLTGINPYCLDYFGEDDMLFPDYYTEDGMLIWNRTNYEPNKDIGVGVGPWNSIISEEGTVETDIANSLPIDTIGDYRDFSQMDPLQKASTRIMRHFDQKHYRSVIWWGKRISNKFGKKQMVWLNYYMGIAYLNRHNYKKAIPLLDKTGNLGLYYKAIAYKKLGITKEYRASLQKMILQKENHPGMYLWAISRLKDMGAL